MNQGNYSTYRGPPRDNREPELENSSFLYRSFTLGRREKAKNVGSAPLSAPPYWSGQQNVTPNAPSVTERIRNMEGSRQSNLEDEAGPSSLYRRMPTDPLYNPNRFSKRKSPTKVGSPTKSEYGGSQYQTSPTKHGFGGSPIQNSPPKYFDFRGSPKQSPSCEAPPSPSADYEIGRVSNKVSKFAGAKENRPVETAPGSLLSTEEIRLVFGIIGRERQAHAVAVGRLLLPTRNQQKWHVKGTTGVMCLLWDNILASYFIHVVSLTTRNVIFEQEIYEEFEFKMSQGKFITFEGDGSVVGVLFADKTEASNFRKALDNAIDAIKQHGNGANRFSGTMKQKKSTSAGVTGSENPFHTMSKAPAYSKEFHGTNGYATSTLPSRKSKWKSMESVRAAEMYGVSTLGRGGGAKSKGEPRVKSDNSWVTQHRLI